MAVKKGRAAKTGLKCGICGEHGGDPDSIGSARRSGSTTCRAARSACRSRGSRPRRRRSRTERVRRPTRLLRSLRTHRGGSPAVQLTITCSGRSGATAVAAGCPGDELETVAGTLSRNRLPVRRDVVTAVRGLVRRPRRKPEQSARRATRENIARGVDVHGHQVVVRRHEVELHGRRSASAAPRRPAC